ncbi:dihydrolipoamide acetyltransferase family protein [Streptomyces sp. NBC_01497]|uniref:dihydrolipoamide acetyltransferase family protein n=1 Tax=Streptomyces sp. NBC_01497 TaxID=2903885 RepID=UPI002E370419|nr:dihydrolipoamide acetyltransferase family protein [Streptomyces sp. NBC_01497]
MAQVLEFKLPDLGEGLTEAEIVGWLVAVGDVVAVDQPVVEVETAKARVEVPCPYGGVVTARFGEEGTELPVGAPLMTVAVGGDAAGGGEAPVAGAAPLDESAGGASAGGASGAAEGDTSGNVLVGYGTAAPSARRRRVAPVLLVETAPVNGSATPAGPAGGVDGVRVKSPSANGEAANRPAVGGSAVDRPVAGVPAGSASVPAGPVPVVSPLVRRLARQHGLDLRQLTGSGRQGLILRTDVERAIERVATPAAVPAATAPPAAAPDGAVRVPLKGVRGAVADKMSRSRQEIPEATCWVDADATELMAARAAMNAAGGPKISVLALLARVCTAALARFPELNATVDTAAREIVRLPAVHLGFAAQTDRGLVVPVVRDAHHRSAESLTEEFARLTERAREGALAPADVTGGTFTLNNYGVFGVDGSTPIINHPEAAMLGVGRIVPKPWVHEGELAIRQVVQLSLTFDHRVCDGGVAGGFLRYVADCVERPAVLLRTL